MNHPQYSSPSESKNQLTPGNHDSKSRVANHSSSSSFLIEPVKNQSSAIGNSFTLPTTATTTTQPFNSNLHVDISSSLNSLNFSTQSSQQAQQPSNDSTFEIGSLHQHDIHNIPPHDHHQQNATTTRSSIYHHEPFLVGCFPRHSQALTPQQVLSFEESHQHSKSGTNQEELTTPVMQLPSIDEWYHQNSENGPISTGRLENKNDKLSRFMPPSTSTSNMKKRKIENLVHGDDQIQQDDNDQKDDPKQPAGASLPLTNSNTPPPVISSFTKLGDAPTGMETMTSMQTNTVVMTNNNNNKNYLSSSGHDRSMDRRTLHVESEASFGFLKNHHSHAVDTPQPHGHKISQSGHLETTTTTATQPLILSENHVVENPQSMTMIGMSSTTPTVYHQQAQQQQQQFHVSMNNSSSNINNNSQPMTSPYLYSDFTHVNPNDEWTMKNEKNISVQQAQQQQQFQVMNFSVPISNYLTQQQHQTATKNEAVSNMYITSTQSCNMSQQASQVGQHAMTSGMIFTQASSSSSPLIPSNAQASPSPRMKKPRKSKSSSSTSVTTQNEISSPKPSNHSSSARFPVKYNIIIPSSNPQQQLVDSNSNNSSPRNQTSRRRKSSPTVITNPTNDFLMQNEYEQFNKGEHDIQRKAKGEKIIKYTHYKF